MEMFDVLDCTGRKTGERIPRDQAHRTGTWHGAFHCLIIYSRNGKPCALFQKRSANKKIAPGKFDISVGGHYASGEDAQKAGPREIAEELGMHVSFSSLVPLGRRVFVYCFTPGITEYEFQDVFLFESGIEPGSLRLQQEEVDCVLEMELEEGIILFSGQTDSIPCTTYSGRSAARISVSAGDFVPCLDNYYLKLLLIARRYFQGERKLLVI